MNLDVDYCWCRYYCWLYGLYLIVIMIIVIKVINNAYLPSPYSCCSMHSIFYIPSHRFSTWPSYLLFSVVLPLRSVFYTPFSPQEKPLRLGTRNPRTSQGFRRSFWPNYGHGGSDCRQLEFCKYCETVREGFMTVRWSYRGIMCRNEERLYLRGKSGEGR